MDAECIVKLSPDAVRELIDAKGGAGHPSEPLQQRHEHRWSFAGAVEVWLPEGAYGDRHLLATLHNLSPNGLAMRARCPIPSGTRISLALHQPKLSAYGHAMVRHCTQAHVGYLIGVEFLYEPDDEATP